jgi:AcrR family transcriptional regulator
MQHSAAIRPRLDSAGRRQTIVEAAMPLFARKGFAGTTTREIARAAGVSEALLFQHFPSKAALYQEILAVGCKGDPALECLADLVPSTETLVRMTQLLLQHFVLGALGEPDEEETRHRLMLQSFLDDGEYARLIGAWVMERVHPLFQASVAAASAAGDLEPRIRPQNAFWFGQHVASMIGYARLGGRDTLPYIGDDDELLADAARFILRGLGMTDEAIERHLAELPLSSSPSARNSRVLLSTSNDRA